MTISYSEKLLSNELISMKKIKHCYNNRCVKTSIYCLNFYEEFNHIKTHISVQVDNKYFTYKGKMNNPRDLYINLVYLLYLPIKNYNMYLMAYNIVNEIDIVIINNEYIYHTYGYIDKKQDMINGIIDYNNNKVLFDNAELILQYVQIMNEIKRSNLLLNNL